MKTKTFPMLYKKTSTGALQQWFIKAVDCGNTASIITTFGQVDGKQQITTDVITSGKNIGRSNETNVFEQACAESQSKWEGKIKKGYVEQIDRAERGRDNIGVGINPMLAHKYSEQGHKILFPCAGQPKLDGIRCIAVIKNGKASLFSRTRKPFVSVPHIINSLETAFKDIKNLVIDGELYNHKFKDNFEYITHIVGQKKDPDPNHKDVEYHIYDVASSSLTFQSRMEIMKTFDKLFSSNKIAYLNIVESKVINDEVELLDYFNQCKDKGFEGAMARNMQSVYENKRSYNLQKIKSFDDDEFRILGVLEGRGKLIGHVGKFVCITKDGVEFEAKMRGSLDRLKDFWNDHSLWTGKMLQVQYQGYTGKGSPRFPVGIRFRDSEDM